MMTRLDMVWWMLVTHAHCIWASLCQIKVRTHTHILLSCCAHSIHRPQLLHGGYAGVSSSSCLTLERTNGGQWVLKVEGLERVVGWGRQWDGASQSTHPLVKYDPGARSSNDLKTSVRNLRSET